MRPYKGDVIKHESTMDVAFDIVSVYESSDSWVLKGRWLNQGFLDTFPIETRCRTIRILKSEFHKILRCQDKHAKCIRYVEWSKYDKRAS